MSQPAAASSRTETPVFRDRSFWGLTLAQFLGAFNDNLFKQLVLLLCLDYAQRDIAAGAKIAEDQYQPYALVVFALPWVVFSGLAGFLSDRSSKQRGIVFFKAAEVVIAFLGLFAFLSGMLWPLLAVLFLMSLHSTFFGPSKYGILPQLFRDRDLPQINGVFQMTTFLAIIFGFASAGMAKDHFEGQAGLAIISGICMTIALAGTLASLMIRRTEPVQPQLRLTVGTLFADPENLKLLRSDRFLCGVLLVSSLFWFTGGVVQPAVNSFGVLDLGLSATRVSLLQGCVGIGIAAGCLISGRLSRHRIRFGLVRVGAWGIVAGLLVLTLLGVLSRFRSGDDAGLITVARLEWIARLTLMELGLSAGLFVVPLQVVLQTAPPEDQKGRMIGTMNLANWLGILLSAAFYGVFEKLRSWINTSIATDFRLPSATSFAALALVILLVAVFYRPADRDLEKAS